MHFEGRLCQQNSRIPVFVRKLFVYFVIRKEIEHKNVKRQVLELLSANGSLKKSQPIRRQMRFDYLQNLEIWLLFQGLAATHNAICEGWVEFLIAVQFLKNLRQKFQPSSRNKTINAKIRNFESRDRSFRGFSKLNESLATWNLLNTLAIVQKKNLTPTS